MKRALTGITAAALVLGTVTPAALAATTTPAYTKAGTVAFTFNGKTVSNPYILDAEDSGNITAFAPVFYFNQLLGQAGITASWNGNTHTWTLQDPSIDASKVSVAGGVGTGNTTITLNGVVIKKINTFAAKDPAGGPVTTYFPAYYVNNIFKAIGINATWDGATGLAVTTKATAFTAKQTAATKIEVDFNGVVDPSTSVKLSQDGVDFTVTPTWSSDNKSVTLDTGYNLPDGTYTVTVGDLTGNVTIAKAKPASINVSTTALAIVDGATVKFNEVDQFGNTVPVGQEGSLSFNVVDATKGGSPAVTQGTDQISLNLKTFGAAKGDNIVVTITDSTYGISKTVTIPVVGVSDLATFKLGTASDNGSSNINAGDQGVVLNYTATDTNGNPAKLPANQTGTVSGHTNVIDGIEFLTSDYNVVDPANFATDADGNLTFTAGNPGSAVITAVDLATGASSSTTITVKNSGDIGSFKLSGPSGLVTAGTTVTLPYTATNAFGGTISQANFGRSYQTAQNSSGQYELAITSSNPVVLDSYDPTKAENTTQSIYFDQATNALKVTPKAAGTTTLYVYVNGVLQNSVTLNVQAAPYPVQITANDIPKYFENGASYTFDASDFTIKDQYGQVYTPKSNDTLTSSGSGSGFTLSSNQLTANANSGTETVTVTFTQPASSLNGNTARSVTYTFNVTAVSSSAIKSYSLDAPTDVYDGVNGFPGGSGNAAVWQPAVTLIGKDGSGNSIQLANDVPYLLTSSDPSVIQVVSGNHLAGNKVSGSAVITAFDANGNQLATATVKADDAYPVAKTLTVKKSVLTESASATDISTDVRGNLTVKDQYGVTMPWVGTWVASNNFITVVNGSTPTFTVANSPAAGDSTVLTYITPSGQTASFTVNFN